MSEMAEIRMHIRSVKSLRNLGKIALRVAKCHIHMFLAGYGR